LQFVQQTHQFQQQQEAQHAQMLAHYQQIYGSGSAPDGSSVPPAPPANAPFSTMLLSKIRDCVRALMSISSSGGDQAVQAKAKLRMSLLSNRARSELLHGMIVAADSITERYRVADASAQQAVNNWTNLREEFMSMLDN